MVVKDSGVVTGVSSSQYKPLDFINFEFRLFTILDPECDSAESVVCYKLDYSYLDDPP